MSQADLKNINKTHYDFVIFGSDLAAHVLAYQLERRFNKKVALVEATSTMSDVDGPVVANDVSLASHFLNFTNDKDLYSFLTTLEDLTSDVIIGDEVIVEPVTLEGSQQIPFVGFGDRKFKSIDYLNDFVVPQRINLKLSPANIVTALNEQFLGDYYNLAELTALNYSEDEERITSATINGAKDIVGDHFLYCLPPKELEKSLSPELLQNKMMQKVFKAKSFSRIRLHLKHKEALCQEPYFHVLYGGKDDFEPCLGQSWSIGEGESAEHFSNWFTLTPAELSEDPEHLGACLRFIKKQVKRIYASGLDDLVAEKIVVETDSFGNIPWDNKLITGQLPKVANLWLCHQQLSKHSGFVGSCLQAQYLMEQLVEILNLQMTTNYIVAEDSAPPPQ